MTTIYVDFDNTIVESNKSVISILNEKFNLNKNEDNLTDYDYNSIVPITKEEKNEIFESDDFFERLEIKDDFLKFIKNNHAKYKIIIVSKGTQNNLLKKERWLKKNFPVGYKFQGITSSGLSKKKIDMRGGIQIDDCTASLDTNAKIKILYKGDHNFKWQKNYENKNILVVNTWKEIEEIIQFYAKYDYKTLKNIRK